MKMKPLLITLSFLLPLTLNAWNEKGHGVITQSTYNAMSPYAQNAIEKMVLPLYYQSLNATTRADLAKTLPDANEYSRMALLPDFWMHTTAQQFFDGLNATLPAELVPYANQPIMGWHFEDTPYPEYDHCPFNKQTINAVKVLTIFEKIINQPLDDRTKAAIFVLWTHILEDLHQPLHGVSGVEKSCKGDAGGNLVCGVYKPNGKCLYNLHKLYDGGMLVDNQFFFNYTTPMNTTMADLIQSYPPSHYPATVINQTEPAALDYQDYQLANFVYSFLDNQNNTTSKGISPEYAQKARAICEERAALASYRLAFIITKYFIGGQNDSFIEKLSMALKPEFLKQIQMN